METGVLREVPARLTGDLRVSVTDRCNFRCQYCMPAEGLPWLERAEILDFEEITRIVSGFAGMGGGGWRGAARRGTWTCGETTGWGPWSRGGGGGDARPPGGEPLVRREFPRLVSML